MMSTIDYKSAGVDIEAGNEAVRRIKKNVESTFSTTSFNRHWQFWCAV